MYSWIKHRLQAGCIFRNLYDDWMAEGTFPVSRRIFPWQIFPACWLWTISLQKCVDEVVISTGSMLLQTVSKIASTLAFTPEMCPMSTHASLCNPTRPDMFDCGDSNEVSFLEFVNQNKLNHNRKEGNNQTYVSLRPPKGRQKPKFNTKVMQTACYIEARHQNQQIQRQEQNRKESSATHLSNCIETHLWTETQVKITQVWCKQCAWMQCWKDETAVYAWYGEHASGEAYKHCT